MRRADRLERIREFPSPLAVLFYLSLLPFFFRNYVGMPGRELEIGDKQYQSYCEGNIEENFRILF